MRGCRLAVTSAVLVLAALAPPPAAGQPDARDAGWTAPRTPAGQPDLQGFWANNSATPMQRPEILGDSELTEEQLTALSRRVEEFRETAQQAGHLLGDRLFQRALGNSTYQDFDDQTGDYNTFWLVQREFENRTSLIIDPPNGRIPPVTPAAQRRAAERAAYAAAHPSDGPEFRPMNDRCLNFASPRFLGGYNSYFLIVQTPDHVAILQEQGHIAVPLPAVERAPAAGGTVDPRRARHHPAGHNDVRPHDVDSTVDDPAVPQADAGSAVRIRLPRGQLLDGEHPGRRARGRSRRRGRQVACRPR